MSLTFKKSKTIYNSIDCNVKNKVNCTDSQEETKALLKDKNRVINLEKQTEMKTKNTFFQSALRLN